MPSAAQSLEGTWRTTGELPPSGPNSRPFSWMKEYTFTDDGKYSMVGYPPIDEKGSYEVVSEDGTTWKVRLFDRMFMSQPSDDSSLQLQWAEDGRSFQVGQDRYDTYPKPK